MLRKLLLEYSFDQFPSRHFTVKSFIQEFPLFQSEVQSGNIRECLSILLFLWRVAEERLVNPKQTTLPFSNPAKHKRHTDLNFLCFDRPFKIRNETNGRTIKTFVKFPQTPHTMSHCTPVQPLIWDCTNKQEWKPHFHTGGPHPEPFGLFFLPWFILLKAFFVFHLMWTILCRKPWCEMFFCSITQRFISSSSSSSFIDWAQGSFAAMPWLRLHNNNIYRQKFIILILFLIPTAWLDSKVLCASALARESTCSKVRFPLGNQSATQWDLI